MDMFVPSAARAAAPASRSKPSDISAALMAAPDYLLDPLARGEPVDTATLRKVVTAAFGESDADGAWDWKSAYDAGEAASVLFLRKFGRGMRARAGSPAAVLGMLAKVAMLLPSHTRRSEESQALQQFSTPIAFWKRLPEQSMRVYRLQTDDGERIIGRLVTPAWVAQAISADGGTLAPSDAWPLLLDGHTILELQDGLQIRRANVMGAFRVELTGFSDAMVERLKAMGLVSEIIAWKLRLFVPAAAKGRAILGALMGRYPLVRIADRSAA